MVSCLVLFHPTITSLTKCRILRSIFYKEKFEIEVVADHTVIIFIWNITQMCLWQAALNIEMLDILVGYGIGDKRECAQKLAFERLSVIRKELQSSFK